MRCGVHHAGMLLCDCRIARASVSALAPHLRPAAAFLRLAGFDDVAASDAFPQGRFVLRAGVERAALDEAIAILTESKRVATASAT